MVFILTPLSSTAPVIIVLLRGIIWFDKMLKRDVFPDPDDPIIARISPGFANPETFLRIWVCFLLIVAVNSISVQVRNKLTIKF